MTEQASPESIFQLALQCTDSDERTVYLEQACGGNEELRREVESLLAAHDAAGSFLDPLVTPASGPTASEVGDIQALFPDLEIVGLIGRGGMGVVYQVRQPELDRFAALKILPPELDSRAGFSERFHREARTMAALNHPNIITIHEFGQRHDVFFFLMEFVDGGDLGHIIHAGSLTPREALAIVPQICDALEYAHDHGVVHRDIKPGNILLDQQGHVKIADFGVAKLIGRAGDPGVPRSYVLGTPAYMAPEQHGESSDVDHRADIYSLGVVFYELLTGSPPGETVEAPSQRVKIDVRLDEVILRALQREPERRYQQVSEFREGVERAVAPPKQRSGPMLMAVAAVVAAGTLGITWMKHWRKDLPPYPPTWRNSIGMEFRPLPGTDTRMSIWELREADWDAFEESNENAGRSVLFRTHADHPVTSLERQDAEAFCHWLTRMERSAGVIRKNEVYRLPTDREWSLAVGLDEPADARSLPPDQRDQETYPWGKLAPAPPKAGNYADTALRERMTTVVTIPAYYDGHAGTSPAGSFPANKHGFFDLGGNVWEWVVDPGEAEKSVLRGGSWAAGSRDGDWTCLLSAARASPEKLAPAERGFRIVLAPGVSAQESTLLDAAREGNLEGVRELLAAGKPPDEANALGQTALHLAAREGRAEVVAALVAAGTEIDTADRDGMTPLHAGAQSGSLETVRLLVEAGAKVRAQTRILHREPFDYAAGSDIPEVLEFLHQRGAELDRRDGLGQTPLGHAVANGAVTTTKWLLGEGADPNVIAQSIGASPLAFASMLGNNELVGLLLDGGAAINLALLNQLTALSLAVTLGHAETAEVLLARGADPNTPSVAAALTSDSSLLRDRMGDANLNLITAPPEPGARARIVRLLHGRGFELEQVDEKGFTPLLSAAFRRNTEVFQALVELGANVDAVDHAGFGALHSAAEQGAERIAEILIAHGADIEAVTKDGRHPLKIAAAQEGIGVLDLLIDAGADIEAEDESWGTTALHVAAFHGRPDAVARLLAKKANPETRSDLGNTALSAAAMGPQALAESSKPGGHATFEGFPTAGMKPADGGTAEDYTACVRILLDGGANPRAISAADGSSAVHFAARYNQVDSLRLLLERGGAVDQPAHAGETPLFAASRAGAIECVKLLVDSEASLAPLLAARTALHASAEKGHQEVARVLLKAGAEPNTRDGLGATPMHWAVSGNHPAMVRLLAEYGADLAARDVNWATPLHCAVGHDSRELILALREAGADPALRNIEGSTAAGLARHLHKTRALAALLEPLPSDSSYQPSDPASP